MMKAKVAVALVVAGVAVAATIAKLQPRHREVPDSQTQQQEQALSLQLLAVAPPSTTPDPASAPRTARPLPNEVASSPTPVETRVVGTNRLERLEQIRESFRSLTSGEPTLALRAAKQMTNDNEREIALVTLVTEWTRGELGSPRQRARAIADYGIEAGLGMELAKDPERALLWANELTDASGRVEVLRAVARALVGSDPNAAFALGGQMPEADRGKFFEGVFADWGGQDTDAALRWADQLPDSAQRDAAVAAIRTQAPVGIGAALSMKDGLPVINQLVPGTPAELSGELHAGDRILALAQGDNSFLDAHNISLQDLVKMVRGDPGTIIQLQVVSADAPPNSPPRTVSIIRDQIKFKR